MQKLIGKLPKRFANLIYEQLIRTLLMTQFWLKHKTKGLTLWNAVMKTFATDLSFSDLTGFDLSALWSWKSWLNLVLLFSQYKTL